MKIISLILYITLYHLSLSSLIQTKYAPNYFTNQLQLFSEADNSEFIVTIDLLSQYTWLYPILETNSTTSISNDNQIEFRYENRTFKCNVLTDTFYVQNNKDKIVTITYLLPTGNSPSYKMVSHGALGMGIDIQDESYSFIHQYKRKGFIDHLSFSIVNRNTLYFGGIPSDDILNKTHSYCNVINRLGSWNCPISEVVVRRNSNELKRSFTDGYVLFTTDNNKNYAPKAFFDSLMYEIYNGEIQSNHFILSMYLGSKKLYYFNKGERITGEITFVIDTFTYKFQLSDFWFCDEDYCDLNIMDNLHGDYWVLGSDFYYNYNLLFDYEKKQINFYSSEGVSSHTSCDNLRNDKYKYMIIIWNTTVLIVGLCNILYRIIFIKT